VRQQRQPRCIEHLFTLEIIPATAMDDSGLSLGDDVLREWQQDLNERENVLKIAEDTFQAERDKTSLPDVLELNVGGTHCTVLRRTLCQMEGSMLAIRFSGQCDESLEKDAAGRFVIDQSIELFGPLLRYLRDMSNESQALPKVRPPFFKDESKQHSFQRMLDYYGCTAWVYRFEIVLLKGVRNDTVISQLPGRHEVETKDLSTFALRTDGLRIDAFEIEFGTAKDAMIGWVEQLTSKDIAQFQVENEREIRDEKRLTNGSIAIDYSHETVLINVSSCPVNFPANLRSIQNGAIVRCERHECKFYINGILAQREEFVGVSMTSEATPVFVCNGKARVVKIEMAKCVEKVISSLVVMIP
jgi:hypothetical protein